MLTFNLKKEWFDKIKSGEKTHEYREMSDSWISKLVPKNFMMDCYQNLDIPFSEKTKCCNLVLGYPPTKKNPEKAKNRVLFAKILKITANVDGKQTDLYKINPNVEDVFDIEFELIKEKR